MKTEQTRVRHDVDMLTRRPKSAKWWRWSSDLKKAKNKKKHTRDSRHSWHYIPHIIR